MDQWNDPDLLEAGERIECLPEAKAEPVKRASISALKGELSVELCQITPRGMTVEALRDEIDKILPPDEARFGQFPMKLSLPFKKSNTMTVTLCCKLVSIRRISQVRFKADFQFLDLTDEGHRLIAVYLQGQ